MARDRRVGGIRKPDLGEPDATAPCRQVGRCTPRQESVEQDAREHLARQFRLDRSADHLRAAPQHGDRGRVLLGVGEEGLLGRSAGVPERNTLHGIEPFHPLRQRGGHGIGQGEVHVVAAEQDVLADGQPGQGEVAPLVGHRDQGEVGRPAADVADQDDIADLHLLPPLVALRREPGVETRPGVPRAT